ncbi:MAG: hypothetical protein IJK03_09425, partial [Oscillospiraceae bacterium]|nr:hypothetical protein [Oscillospiraceae bacterium]MBQ6428983.1 hypothetical protein [Oscillospiraceae bacterium]
MSKTQKEIGGYLELERFSGSLYHDNALALSSGRACLAYLIEQRRIDKMLLPDLLCDVVAQVCRAYGVQVRDYAVGLDLRPENMPQPENDEWLYLVNYYGQLKDDEIAEVAAHSPKLIVDNAHAFFTPAFPGVDTLYTCRKFLGVADGGFLYTEARGKWIARDESHSRMGFLLGRFERPANEFFAEAQQNNAALDIFPKRMSLLTENLLRAVDYDHVRDTRTENYNRLHAALGNANELILRPVEGAYAYPLLLAEGERIRQKLIEQKIYVPTLWPNALCDPAAGSTARRLARDILPLPCDQRYGLWEMDAVIAAVLREL